MSKDTSPAFIQKAGLFCLTKMKVMKQHYGQYTAEDHAVWKILFERQVENLKDKACGEYLVCLDRLGPSLHGIAIPDFDQLNSVLLEQSGWQIEVVPGHIPVKDFFMLLAVQKFPSSTWLRSMQQLDYLEEPDMFHDIFGHIPLFMDEQYANFMHAFGQMGVLWMHNATAVSALRSLYWFTIEFGLLKSNAGRRIYGAGILSSYGECRQVFDAETTVCSFDIDQILTTEFRTDAMQNVYFDISGMQEFLTCLPAVEQYLETLGRQMEGC